MLATRVAVIPESAEVVDREPHVARLLAQQPFRHEFLVDLAAFLGTILGQVVVFAAQADNRLGPRPCDDGTPA